MCENIELGDTVKDLVSGFTGVAVVRSEFLNGCIQFEVMPKVRKDNKIPESIGIDVAQLKVIKKKEVVVEEDDIGGPYSSSIKMRGY